MYGCMKRDYFIFWGNMPGLVLGLFYAVSVLPFLCKKVQNRSDIVLLFIENCLKLYVFVVSVVMTTCVYTKLCLLSLFVLFSLSQYLLFSS